MGVVKSLKQSLEFPSLFSGDDLDTDYLAQQKQQNGATAERKEECYPLPIVEARFPRIAEVIQTLWGTPELDSYFDKLLIDDRGDRAGFPEDVITALFTLSRQHIEQFGFRTPSDIWTNAPNTYK